MLFVSTEGLMSLGKRDCSDQNSPIGKVEPQEREQRNKAWFHRQEKQLLLEWKRWLWLLPAERICL